MTMPMKKPTQSGTRKQSAFTLIELLVVIAIIGILAALTFPTVTSIKENATRRKVKAELHQVQTAIDSYHAKFGFYPPDNPCSVLTNQLYFELLGVVLNANTFETLDGSARILDTVTDFQTVFGQSVGPCVRGFVNVSKGAGSDDAVSATAFLKGLKPNQYGEIKPNVRVLTCSVTSADDSINPWRYNSSSPTNNSGSYDLWVDISIAGKTNRISNWSEQPQIVN